MADEIRFYGKRGPYAFMSNFFPSKFELDGKEWDTVEHRYQAMKSIDQFIREDIRCGYPLGTSMKRAVGHNVDEELEKIDKTPGMSKKKGQRIEKRKDWESVKEMFMYEALTEKFKIPELRKKLLDTGSAVLIEDSPSDLYWGIGDNGQGQNRLGYLLMTLREQIRLTMPSFAEAKIVMPKRQITVVLEVIDEELAKTIYQRWMDCQALKGCTIKKIEDGDICQRFEKLQDSYNATL